jgi:hypothetical protein
LKKIDNFGEDDNLEEIRHATEIGIVKSNGSAKYKIGLI